MTGRSPGACNKMPVQKVCFNSLLNDSCVLTIDDRGHYHDRYTCIGTLRHDVECLGEDVEVDRIRRIIGSAK